MAQHDCAIIILAHNGLGFTRHCLSALLRSDERPRELFLIDNASDDATPELFAQAKPLFEAEGIRVVTWRNCENKGCSLARNEPWEQATAKYVVFMDNDAVVCTPDWLARLVRIMDEKPGLAVLGPKMIYPYVPCPIQCAGASLSKLGRVWFRGRGHDRHEPRFNEFCDVPILISACWIMRNSLRDDVGYLDELFHPVQYEDLDLCMRALLAGYRVGYTPEVEMYHFEGITTESPGRAAYQLNIARNSLKFRERYHRDFRTVGEDISPADLKWLTREEMGMSLDLVLPPPLPFADSADVVSR